MDIHKRGVLGTKMLLLGKKIGFALTGAFYTFEKTILQISRLIEEGADVLPIMSFNSYNIDSKFGKAKYFIDRKNHRKKSCLHNRRSRAYRS